MSKPTFYYLLLFIFILLSQSCATNIKVQPKAVTDGQYFLQQGTAEYLNDEYPKAAKSFTQALRLYQSIDNFTGIIESRINLLETAIAIGNFKLAQQQITKLETLLDNKNNIHYQQRITLLKVKILFQKNLYSEALVLLNPMLPAFDNNNLVKVKTNSLNILSSKARLEVITKGSEASLWLNRFERAIQQSQPVNERFMALLLRTQALLKQQQGMIKESRQLVHQALSLHHKLAYRRGIAASLQQLASLEQDEKNWSQAHYYLQRALKIHLWTLNKMAAIKVIKQLIKTDKHLNNESEIKLLTEQPRILK